MYMYGINTYRLGTAIFWPIVAGSLLIYFWYLEISFRPSLKVSFSCSIPNNFFGYFISLDLSCSEKRCPVKSFLNCKKSRWKSLLVIYVKTVRWMLWIHKFEQPIMYIVNTYTLSIKLWFIFTYLWNSGFA